MHFEFSIGFKNERMKNSVSFFVSKPDEEAHESAMSDAKPRGRARGRPRSGAGLPGTSSVQALDRSIVLLRVLAGDGNMTLSDLALKSGTPTSSAHRLLGTLQKHGLVDFNPGTQEWMIGVEAFRIGSAFVQRASLPEVGRSVLHRLVEQTGETANLAIADGGEVVFLSQVETQNPIRAFFRPGTRVRMHSSGIGKALMAQFDPASIDKIIKTHGLERFTGKTLTARDALLADLERIRQRGWSLDDEENFSGMRCVAAAIFNAYGEPYAGVSISGPTVRFDEGSIAEKAGCVRRAARDITRLTGGLMPGRSGDD
jgi:IclR family acetate operon transcriptional repressor